MILIICIIKTMEIEKIIKFIKLTLKLYKNY